MPLTALLRGIHTTGITLSINAELGVASKLIGFSCFVTKRCAQMPPIIHRKARQIHNMTEYSLLCSYMRSLSYSKTTHKRICSTFPHVFWKLTGKIVTNAISNPFYLLVYVIVIRGVVACVWKTNKNKSPFFFVVWHCVPPRFIKLTQTTSFITRR